MSSLYLHMLKHKYICTYTHTNYLYVYIYKNTHTHAHVSVCVHALRISENEPRHWKEIREGYMGGFGGR